MTCDVNEFQCCRTSLFASLTEHSEYKMEPYRYLGLLRGGVIGRAAGGRALNAMVNCGECGVGF